MYGELPAMTKAIMRDESITGARYTRAVQRPLARRGRVFRFRLFTEMIWRAGEMISTNLFIRRDEYTFRR